MVYDSEKRRFSAIKLAGELATLVKQYQLLRLDVAVALDSLSLEY